MLDILVKDDYFEDPDSIRKLGLSYKNYRIDNEIEGMGFGWRGQRTLPIRKQNNRYCQCCNQLITTYSSSDEYMHPHAQNIFDLCAEHFNLSERCSEEATITTYFHITTEETRGAFPDFWQDRFHKDNNCLISGIVYLSPDAPLHAGTSIMDGRNNKIINIENKYNRLVAYEGFRVHALSDVFGTCRDTGRMTYTFFIHTVGSASGLD